jgi:hypothetical protein
VWIGVWNTTPTAGDIEDMAADVGDLVAGSAGPIGLLPVVRKGTLSLAPDARHRAAAFTREFGQLYAACGVVLLGGGFWSAALGSVLTNIMVSVGTPLPLRTFRDVEPASAWVGERLAVPSGTLQGAYERLAELAAAEN